MVRFSGAAGRWFAVTALAGAMVYLGACESETAVAGATLVQSDGGGGAGGDAGSVGGSDGAAEVSIVGSDGGSTAGDGSTSVDSATAGGDVLLPGSDATITDPAASCAGKCGQAQPNKWKCQCDAQCAKYGDCCADYKQLCTNNPGGGPGPDPVQILGCLEKSCAGNVTKCTADPLCAQFWDCAKACKESECLQVCGSKFDLKKLEPVLQPLLDCGQKASCFEGGGTTNPPPVTGPVCGDKKCEQPENSLNCEKDCPNTPPGDAQKCLNEKCKDSYNACFKSQPCVAAVACINTGKPQNQCVNDQKTGQLLNAMLQCGYQNGCLGGSSQQPVCGNGKCESGENFQSCPKDCEAPPPPTDDLTKCVAEKCSKSYASCVANEGCAKALACYAKTGSIQQCAQGLGGTGVQLLSALAQCAFQQNCLSGGGTGTTNSCQGKCGQYSANAPCQCNQLCKQFGNCCGDYDAVCAGGGTSPNSCQGKCGQFTPGAPCQCNGECMAAKNCCGDFEKLCAGQPPPTAVCGDGICTAPTETAQSCPKDCGSTPPPPGKPCKTKGDCAEAEICCGKADGTQVCSAPAMCK